MSTGDSGGSTSRRTFLTRSLAVATVGALGPVVFRRRVAAQDNVLNANTWGGSWTAAEDAAYFKPFTERTGIRITAYHLLLRHTTYEDPGSGAPSKHSNVKALA